MIDEAEALTYIPGALEYLRNTFSRLGEKAALYSLTISGKSGLFQSVTEKFSPLERFFAPITLLPFTNHEISEVLAKASVRSGVKFDSKVETDITRDSEGQPYVVQIFGFRLYEEASKQGIRVITPHVLEQAKPEIFVLFSLCLLAYLDKIKSHTCLLIPLEESTECRGAGRAGK